MVLIVYVFLFVVILPEPHFPIFSALFCADYGAGMSLIMTNISETIGRTDPMIFGFAIGIVGMLMAILKIRS